jgi:hypothetical protein
MTLYIKERPRCRQEINKIREERNTTLKEMWDKRYTKLFFPTDGMRKQLKKMLLEAGYSLSDLR